MYMMISLGPGYQHLYIKRKGVRLKKIRPIMYRLPLLVVYLTPSHRIFVPCDVTLVSTCVRIKVFPTSLLTGSMELESVALCRRKPAADTQQVTRRKGSQGCLDITDPQNKRDKALRRITGTQCRTTDPCYCHDYHRLLSLLSLSRTRH